MGKATGFMDYDRQDKMAEDPKERIKHFKEFHTPLSKEEQELQGARCMACGVPFCQSGQMLMGMASGCPLHNLVPEWNDLIFQENWEEAYYRLKKTNNFPEFTSRVCPALCEAACTCGLNGDAVSSKANEYSIIENAYKKGYAAAKPVKVRTGKKVAVVGAGPSGLTCAGDLAKKGYEVTVFEAFHTAGGVLVYGIPEFRLPKAIVKKEVENLQDLGVEVKTNMVIGRVLSVDELFEMGYKAIFIGSGAGLPSFMGIEGEDLIGVYSANEYLTRTNLMKAYLDDYDTPIIKSKSVAVVGGGNVAMDAARCAKRLGAENVYIVYRRGMEEMPARKEEVHHAMEEGIIFKNLNNPVKILGDENGRVRAMECIEMELGEPDASGRRKPIAKEGSNFELPVDTVIMSIGTSPNPLIRSTTPGLDTNKRGCLVVNEDTMQTTREGVYAGGDAVTGAATVILAMGAGKQAAQSIDEYLSKN